MEPRRSPWRISAYPIDRLTASPATVYRGDPIEGLACFFYSVIHAREYQPRGITFRNLKEINRGDLCDFSNWSECHSRDQR
jgi:hypothetical protein